MQYNASKGIGICGVVRRIDALGRVVIPMAYRKQLQLKENQLIEMIATEAEIIIRKKSPKKPVQGALEDLRRSVQNEPTLRDDSQIMQELEKISALIDSAYKG